CTAAISGSHSPRTRRRWSFWRDGLFDLDDLALRVQVDDVAHGWALTLDRVEDDQTAVTGVLFADAGQTSGGGIAPVHAVDEALLIGVAHARPQAGISGARHVVVDFCHGGHGGIGAVAVQHA